MHRCSHRRRSSGLPALDVQIQTPFIQPFTITPNSSGIYRVWRWPHRQDQMSTAALFQLKNQWTRRHTKLNSTGTRQNQEATMCVQNGSFGLQWFQTKEQWQITSRQKLELWRNCLFLAQSQVQASADQSPLWQRSQQFGPNVLHLKHAKEHWAHVFFHELQVVVPSSARYFHHPIMGSRIN